MDPISIAMALAQFAPSLIQYFTGSDKAATVAQQVVGIAQTVTGTSTPAAALATVQADPKAAMDFQIAVLASENELNKAYLLDVQSAREMQIAALAQDDKFSKRFVYLFAAAWSIFAMAYFFCVTFIYIDEGGRRVADTILGVLITSVVGGLFGFFYGSTKGSEAKSAILAKAGK